MRVAIDARELLGRRTGVGRYLSEIMRAWGAMPAAAEHEFVLCSPEPVDVPESSRLRVSTICAPGTGTWWEQLVLPRLVRRAGANVLFAPAYSGPLLCPVPMVVAVHDVSFVAHPEWFGWREGMRRRLVTRLAARRASRVLALTHSAKRDVVGRLGVNPDKVEVTSAGAPREVASANRLSATAEPVRNTELRVLFVGSILERRHLVELVAGFGQFAAANPTAHLDIVGDNRTRPPLDLAGAAVSAGVADRVHLRAYVSDEELDGYYRRAGAFVWLSAYEGFGLTPLEALAAGVPIVVLDTPVAREVYGDAACYVDAPRPDLVEGALRRVFFDAAERDRIRAAAPAVLAAHSWERTAERVLEALTASGR